MFRFASAAVVLTLLGLPVSARCCRVQCVPEDPTVVAARDKARAERDYRAAVGLAVGLGVLGVGAAVQFIRDTRQAIELANQERQPWDVEPDDL